MRRSGQAWPLSCKVTQCDADASCDRVSRTLSFVRCDRNAVVPRLSLSAQSFLEPARCSTSNCTRCTCAHVAARRRKVQRGSAVLKSLFKPLSALVLSDAEGNTKRTCLLRRHCQEHCASASCAQVSKQPMYGCSESCS